MFFRYVVPFAFLALAFSTPWLVVDWFAGTSSQLKPGDISSAVEKIPGQVKDTLSQVGEKFSPRPDVQKTHRPHTEPYPLASQTPRETAVLIRGAEQPGQVPVPVVPPSAAADLQPDPVPETAATTPAAAVPSATPPTAVFLRLFKEERELELWKQGPDSPGYTLHKVYKVKQLSGHVGPKQREGDGQAPEGFYSFRTPAGRGKSAQSPRLELDFPNAYDRHHARSGSGLRLDSGERSRGTLLLADDQLKEIHSLTEAAMENGQDVIPIHSFPFRMSDARMEREWKKQPKWIDFWLNLKEGYDFFENVNQPPRVGLQSGNYVFEFSDA